jgi:hypothetical protein
MPWVDAYNARDHEVCFRQVERGEVYESADGVRSVDFGLSGGDLAYGAILETVHLWEEGRETWNSDISCEEVAN